MLIKVFVALSMLVGSGMLALLMTAIASRVRRRPVRAASNAHARAVVPHELPRRVGRLVLAFALAAGVTTASPAEAGQLRSLTPWARDGRDPRLPGRAPRQIHGRLGAATFTVEYQRSSSVHKNQPRAARQPIITMALGNRSASWTTAEQFTEVVVGNAVHCAGRSFVAVEFLRSNGVMHDEFRTLKPWWARTVVLSAPLPGTDGVPRVEGTVAAAGMSALKDVGVRAWNAEIRLGSACELRVEVIASVEGDFRTAATRLVGPQGLRGWQETRIMDKTCRAGGEFEVHATCDSLATAVPLLAGNGLGACRGISLKLDRAGDPACTWRPQRKMMRPSAPPRHGAVRMNPALVRSDHNSQAVAAASR